MAFYKAHAVGIAERTGIQDYGGIPPRDFTHYNDVPQGLSLYYAEAFGRIGSNIFYGRADLVLYVIAQVYTALGGGRGVCSAGNHLYE